MMTDTILALLGIGALTALVVAAGLALGYLAVRQGMKSEPALSVVR